MTKTLTARAASLRALRRRQARRPLIALTGLTAALILAMGIRVLLGNFTVTIPDFFTILGGGDVSVSSARFIVMEDKLPRAVLGTLTGLAFGAAGAIFQLLLRNPLASPDIIGISNGASLGAVLAIVYWGASGFTISIFAVLFALATALITMLLAAGRGNVGNRFILMGIGVAALGNAIITCLMERISQGQAVNATVWMIGSLAPANWSRISILSGILLCLLPFILWGVNHLKASAVGDDLAQGLGVPVGAIRWYYIAVGVILAAIATAAAGPIAFVAFVSGPIARWLMGGRHTLLGAALVGAVIVVLADFAAVTLFPSSIKFPVGVLTGLFGAPVLIWLLVQNQKEGTS